MIVYILAKNDSCYEWSLEGLKNSQICLPGDDGLCCHNKDQICYLLDLVGACIEPQSPLKLFTNVILFLQTNSQQSSLYLKYAFLSVRGFSNDFPDLDMQLLNQLDIVKKKFPKSPVQHE